MGAISLRECLNNVNSQQPLLSRQTVNTCMNHSRKLRLYTCTNGMCEMTKHRIHAVLLTYHFHHLSPSPLPKMRDCALPHLCAKMSDWRRRFANRKGYRAFSDCAEIILFVCTFPCWSFRCGRRYRTYVGEEVPISEKLRWSFVTLKQTESQHLL